VTVERVGLPSFPKYKHGRRFNAIFPLAPFSLLTALLLTTIVGLSVIVVPLWREVGPLRMQVRSLRTEQGFLNVDDVTQAQAIQVGTGESHHSNWRIYLPPGGRYSLCAYDGLIPPDPNGQSPQSWFDGVKLTGSGMTDTLDGGEFVLETELAKQDDHWQLKMFKANGMSFGSISLHNFGDWLSDEVGQSVRSAVGYDQQAVYPPGQPILLMKTIKPIVTRSGSAITIGVPTGPADGVVVWIEQQPPPSPNSTAKP
jgi:hypothetical protein